MTSDEDLQAHFERLYTRGGPDADIARAVLDLLDRTVEAEEAVTEILDTIGDEPKAAAERLETFERLEKWAEEDTTFPQFGELNEETLEKLTRLYERYEAESLDLQELCVEAGLLARDDFDTNPISLIRMFLPTGETK